jgi:choline kinase
MSNKYLIIIPEITKGMKSIGSKALLKINATTTILDHQIKLIKSINRRNKIYLSTGFQHNKILKVAKKYTNVHTIYDENYEKYNDGKHIINFIEYIDSPDDVFIINNGLLFKKDCFEKPKPGISKIYLLDRIKDNFTIGCETKESKYLFYELANRWSECSFISANILIQIKNRNAEQCINNYFMFEILNFISDNNHIEYDTISYKKIMKVNGVSDLNKAKRFI